MRNYLFLIFLFSICHYVHASELAASDDLGLREDRFARQPVQLSEKEYRCLNARRSLEAIFSKEADYLNQPFVEVRDAIQAYKKLNCVYTAGFLFSDQRQVERYFRYRQQSRTRFPASFE